MNLSIDAYAHRSSLIHSWEIRTRFIGLMLLLFSFASVQTLAALPAMFMVTAAVYALSRLPLSFLLDRLRAPSLFLLFIVLLLPLIAGETVLWQIGPFAFRQEGIITALLILSRFLCILTISIVLFGTAPFLQTVNAMRALGLPRLLADMTLFFYRYLLDLAHQLTTMQTAMRLRGFTLDRLSWHHLTMLAGLAGTMLIRSYEQSERVYHGMRLRGYGHVIRPPSMLPVGARDIIGLAIVSLIALGFFLVA